MEKNQKKNMCVYACVCITESLCYIPETNTLWINYSSILKRLKKEYAKEINNKMTAKTNLTGNFKLFLKVVYWLKSKSKCNFFIFQTDNDCTT